MAVGSNYAGETVPNPRPEYDHPQHNEPNWLLVAFRDEPREPGETEAERIAWWKGFGADHRTTATDEEREHFRRVLTRLARFTEQETPA
ncbi:hypothetical protein [Microbacterium sp. T32]|uniref:hypothetical protein n=1 Tax=Microbacterium sp. T32 TaxID=1776083 RepID=UPI0012E77031|nr:hypothetical protein [Microbacterium sp. T32]